MNKFKLITIDEIIERGEREWQETLKRCEADDEGLVLHGGENLKYFIQSERINTPTRTLQWIDHLSEKNWFTMKDVRIILWYVRKYHGVDPYAEDTF